jgi:hypothetical protein
MAAPPSLDADAMRLLKVLAGRPDYMRGGEAMRILGLDREPFAKLVNQLASDNLVQVSGPRTADQIDFAMLSVHPSNFGFVRGL